TKLVPSGVPRLTSSTPILPALDVLLPTARGVEASVAADVAGVIAKSPGGATLAMWGHVAMLRVAAPRGSRIRPFMGAGGGFKSPYLAGIVTAAPMGSLRGSSSGLASPIFFHIVPFLE